MQDTTETTDQAQKPSFAGLTNKQLALIFYRFETYEKKLKKYLETGMMPKDVMSPMGMVTIMIPAKPGEVEEFSKSEYFSLTQSIVTDLRPIVEMIEETDEDLKKIQDVLK
jgi:hypothetical protein